MGSSEQASAFQCTSAILRQAKTTADIVSASVRAEAERSRRVAGSRVRKQRLPNGRHEETGIVSIGGKLPMTTQSRTLVSDKMFEGMSMVMAPTGFGAIIHSLEFAKNRSNPGFLNRWPEFADSIAEDSIGWGLWGAIQNLPQDPAILGALRDAALLRRLLIEADLGQIPLVQAISEYEAEMLQRLCSTLLRRQPAGDLDRKNVSLKLPQNLAA
jgi:hypothetical protein